VAVEACRPCGIFWCDREGLELLPPVPKLTELNQLNEALTLGTAVTKSTTVSKSPPVAVLIFALLCVVVSTLVAQNPRLMAELAFFAVRPLNQLGLTLISGLFIHVGLLHLLGNLYFLFLFGGDVEDVIGTDDSLLLFLYAGIAAGMAAGATGTNPNIPSVGSSAGITAFLAFYALAYPHARISALRSAWVSARWNNKQFMSRISFPLTTWFGFWMLAQIAVLAALGPSAINTSITMLSHAVGATVGAAYYFLSKR
ncbi:MAG: rhomboid family intramembrane serine protease, partial [Deltaproteobacteria bacterium]|nr:rhomboid family intramembrane serine protease [Deltaproteobacteria bacterium]